MLKVMAGVLILTYPGIETVLGGTAEPLDDKKICAQPT